MNIILFSFNDFKYTNKNENIFFFNKNDERYSHITKILRLKVGDVFKCGLINADIGEGIIKEINENNLLFSFNVLESPKPLQPIHLILGISRPIQLKRILKDVSTIGISSIHLMGTILGEKSYMNSALIEKENIQKYLIEGASQGGSTLLPSCTIYNSLYHFLISESSPKDDDVKIVFDIMPNYKKQNIDYEIKKEKKIYLAIGSERGWAEKEREIFYNHNFISTTLGKRILRTETATIASLSYILTKMGVYP